MSLLRGAMGAALAIAGVAAGCHLVVGSVDDLGPVPGAGGGVGAAAGEGGGGQGSGGAGDTGTACDDDAQCTSGFCVDGVCCASRCDGPCEGCNGAHTGSADGVCAPFYGIDPDMECSDRMVCGASGTCEHGVVRWAVSVAGSLVQSAEAVATDAQGNIYVVGRARGAVDFSDTGCASACTKVTTADDAFVLKLDADGVYQWALLLTGPGDDAAHDVAVDAQGNVIVVGHFSQSIDLAGTNLTGDGSVDGFWLKLDAAGQYVAHTGFSETGMHVPLYLALDDGGGSLVASELTYTGEAYQLLLTKIDVAGAVSWSQEVNGDRVGPVGLDVRNGKIYVAVRVRNDATFPAPVNTVAGGTSPSLALWTMTDGASPTSHALQSYQGSDIRLGALVLPSDGVVMAVTTDGGLALPGGSLNGLGASDAALVTLDDTGTSTAWRRAYSNDNKTQLWGGVAIDPLDGAIVGVGYHDGALNNLPDTVVANMGINDAFLVRISAASTAIWARGYGELDPQEPRQQRALDVALDPGGDIVMVGDFEGQMAFGPELLGPSLEDDAFVVKLSP